MQGKLRIMGLMQQGAQLMNDFFLHGLADGRRRGWPARNSLASCGAKVDVPSLTTA